MILSLEPVEALRYLPWLAPGGTLVTSASAFVNIPDYPAQDEILARVRSLPHAAALHSNDRPSPH